MEAGKSPGASRALFVLPQRASKARMQETDHPCGALGHRTGDPVMPLLFYFPAIVMAGLYRAAADDMARMHRLWFGPHE
jgi:hypothetical protein